MKDWLAGSVSGPKGYGHAMGRQARENGSALANVVFISHGARPNGGQITIFDTAAEMQKSGYKPRFTEIVEIDLALLTKDERLLFRSLQTAMIGFAYVINFNGAFQYMRREKAREFLHGLGPSLIRSMVDCHLFDKIEEARTQVSSYGDLVNRPFVVLNMEKPGSGDILEQFIVRAVTFSGSKLQYGFTRTGLTGFDVVAVPMVEETLKSIYGATTHYKW